MTHSPLTREERAQRTQEAALAAFVSRKAEIDEMLARLQALSEDHFWRSPDEVNWADVGMLGHIAERLAEITAFAFGEDA